MIFRWQERNFSFGMLCLWWSFFSISLLDVGTKDWIAIAVPGHMRSISLRFISYNGSSVATTLGGCQRSSMRSCSEVKDKYIYFLHNNFDFSWKNHNMKTLQLLFYQFQWRKITMWSFSTKGNKRVFIDRKTC